MEDAVPMILRCYRHQLAWGNDHVNDMISDGLVATESTWYPNSQDSLPEDPNDRPPNDAWIPIDWSQGASSEC